MAELYEFNESDMVIDERLGYPKAYAKLCRDGRVSPYNHGPPFTFTPYILQENESMRANELDQMFPIIDPKAKPTAKSKIYLSLLWKQLSHLGNAGFDPDVIRVDTYGNVLYYHADPASPLAWKIDHWFPCSRGGLTLASNLRILQWQVCKKKHNKLEFLLPWWNLQLGISVNQFLSVFNASNSDFRRRAFSFLFKDGENEELNASQAVESHCFPQHFMESKDRFGLAPAAIVVSRKESYDLRQTRKSFDNNTQMIKSFSSATGTRKGKTNALKENENPNFVTNPYQAIVMARDSLKQREEAHKMEGEIQKLTEEVDDLRNKNDEEKLTIQDLEFELIKHRRKAEKCRRLAEAQSSYRIMLEKMIRDAMHQSVVYKEQVRLNQAAANALTARLEAQKAMVDASEKDLRIKFKQRDELEAQIRPEWDQSRKRSRMDDCSFFDESENRKALLYLPGIRSKTRFHKELRVFLDEEQKASKAVEVPNPVEYFTGEKREEHDDSIVEDKLQNLELGQEHKLRERGIDGEDDEESRKERGKGNVERWLGLLLENSEQELHETDNLNRESWKDELIKKLDDTYPLSEKPYTSQLEEEKPITTGVDVTEKEQNIGNEARGEVGICKKFEKENEKMEKNGNDGMLARSDSASAFRRIPSSPARAFLRIPSSPSLISGMKKGVDCIRKKPVVISDEDEDHTAENNNNSFIATSFKTIKKAVKL